MSYEKLVGKRLKSRFESGELVGHLVEHQWFHFKDANGYGCCQTDYYIICNGFIVLLECKLTQSDYADDQMAKLYKPILEHIYEVPVVCLQVCKNMRRHPERSVRDVKQLMDAPFYGVYTWHYLP